MNLPRQNSEFFVVGGTMYSQTPSYIKRPADEELLQITTSGKFGYILASRQMGKSSLMIRTVYALRQQGICTAIIDLSEIGTHDFTAEEWYLSLLYELEYELELSVNPEQWWHDHAALTPVRRFTDFLRNVVLQEIQGQVVVFIDEIDTTLRLKFTDDFFAAVRALYNARTKDPALNRLTFIFLGVATPSDLIKDSARTPFNIGQRVNITDFTLEEAIPLTKGLPLPPAQAHQVLAWVLKWTGGHPYLTQRLCQAIVEHHCSKWSEADVDQVVSDTFLGKMSNQDDNLQFVRKMLTEQSPDLGGTLDLYRTIHLGLFAVPDDNSPLATHLKLSGIVRQNNGHLQVRNKIYETVFDIEWVNEIEARAQVADPRELARLRALADARQKQIEAERKRTEYQARTARRLYALTIALIVLLVLAVGATLFAFRKVREIEAVQRIADAALVRRMATQILDHLNDLDLALLLSLEAGQLTQTNEVMGNLLVALESNPYLITMLHAHTGRVEKITFSPDGQILASAGWDKSVILWDVLTGQPLGKPLTGHTDKVLSVAFSPDGRILASGSADLTIRLWDVATGQPLGPPLTGHESWVHSVAFSPDGRLLASSSGDKTVRIWDVETRQPLGQPLTGHTDEVHSVAFSPDGQILASAGRDKTIILWNVLTRQPLGKPLTGHTGWIWNVAFSPDGQTLASAGFDHSIILWDVATGQPLNQLFTENNTIVTGVAFSPDGQLLASCGGDRNITLWDIEALGVNPKALDTVKPLSQPLTGHTSTVWGVAFSPDGQTLASSGEDQTVILWDSQARQGVSQQLNGHGDGVGDVAFSPDSRLLASASWDNTIILWDTTTGQPIGQPLAGHLDGVESVAFSPNGQILASGSKDKSIILWDVTTSEPIGPPLTGHTDVVESVAFSPDGQTLASSSMDGTILLWNMAAEQPAISRYLIGHEDGVEHVVFSPDGRILASGSADHTIILWNVITGEPISQPLTGHTSWVHSVTFSPDGQTLASAGADGAIFLWSVTTGQPIGQPLIGHEQEVNSVVFSPDGKLLVSGGRDNNIILWDVATGLPIDRPIASHTDWVWRVAFSPDGKFLATASADKTILIWDISFETLHTLVCRKANRNLTSTEWDRYIGSRIPYSRTCF